MKKCIIVGAGEIYSPVSVSEGDLVIAADGGYDYLKRAGIKPDILIGDFDSIDELPSDADVEIIKHPVEKDDTDMFLAYKTGASRGYEEFYVYGGVGGREDHTFANYCLLLRAKNENNLMFLIGNCTRTFVIKNEKIKLNSNRGNSVSIFAIGSEAEGVNINGLKYNANDISLRCDYPIGVSNSFVENEEAEISVKNGALLIIQQI